MSLSEPQRHTACLITGAEDLCPLPGFEKKHLVKSRSSGLVFDERIPTHEQLVAHYNTYPRSDFISPVTIKGYHALLDAFEPYRKTGRLLDIGCDVGHFLEVARERGWEVYGTEYTDEALQICQRKGINMAQGKLNPENYDAGFFDVITAFEVLEHINNPTEEVRNIYHLLRSGGLFYFTTPNFNSLERHYLGAAYNVIDYPEHLAYYTPKTVDLLMRTCGLRKKRILTTGVSFTRIRTSQGVSEEAYVSETSTDEQIRRKIDRSPLLQALKSTVNTILSMLKVGNSMKGYYIKP